MPKLKSVRVAIHLECDDGDSKEITTSRFVYEQPVDLKLDAAELGLLENALHRSSINLMYDVRNVLHLRPTFSPGPRVVSKGDLASPLENR